MVGRILSYQYDAASNRTRITWPDGYYAAYVYDVLNRVTAVEENGATSGAGLLASYAYDDLGRRTGITRAGGAGAATTYAWDGADRLSSLAQDLAGTANDAAWGFTYNPASQIGPRTSTNDSYGYHPPALSLPATINGLNQIATLNGTAFSYDARGNEIANGSNTFSYDLENHFTGLALPTAATYAYDPAGRMQTATVGGTASTFLYDGANLVAEYNGSGTMTARHVFGPGVDEPLVSYSGPGTTSRSFLLADNTGSIIAATDASGNLIAQIGYSPSGERSAWTGPRFAFTGQAILPGSHLFNYKARIYDPIFDRVCIEHGIEHRLTKPYHPWTNGQAERMNRTIKDATIKAHHYDDLESL